MTWMPTHIQLTVQRAKGLLTKGKHGTNDCFVVMSLGKEKFQTSVKEKASPDVEWCEECELTIPKQGNTAEIKLTVLHRNFLGVDEFLGQTSVALGDQDVYEQPRNRWYQLHSKPDKKDTKRRGELQVRLSFTVKAAAAVPSVSSSDLADGRKGRGSLLSLPKVSGALGGSLASLGHKKKSLRKLAASVGHKVAKAGGRRRGSSSRGTSEAGSDVGSDLGWDDGASSNADPGVISEGEEDMFGFDDDQGRRASPHTPELHGRVQPRALLDETPLSSLSSSVQSGLSDLAHPATYEQPGETAVRHEAAVAPSPLAATDPAAAEEAAAARSDWPGSGRSSGRLRATQPPHAVQVTATEPPRTEVTSTEPPRRIEVTATEPPRRTEVTATEPPRTEVTETESPHTVVEVIPAELPHTDEVPVRSAAGGGTGVGVSPPAGLTAAAGGASPPAGLTAAAGGGSVPGAVPRWGEGAARPADQQETRLVPAPQSDGAAAGAEQRQQPQRQLGSMFSGLTSLRKAQEPAADRGEEQEPAGDRGEEQEPAGDRGEEQEQTAQKQPEAATLGAGEAAHRSARGASARLSGRLRPAEVRSEGQAAPPADRTGAGPPADRTGAAPPQPTEVRSEGQAAPPADRTGAGPPQPTDAGPPADRTGAGPPQPAANPFDDPQNNPFDEPDKNPFEEPEKNPFDEPEKKPFDEPEKNPFEEPEKNPFDEPVKNPFDEQENNPFEEPAENPFDEPDENYDVDVTGVEEGTKLPKEKSKKRGKLGKMFRGLKPKKEDAAYDSPEKSSNKSSQGSDEADGSPSSAAVLPPAPTLRSVQTWAGASLRGAGPDQPPPLNPFEEAEEEEEEAAPTVPEEAQTVSPVRDRTGRTANLKDRFRKRDKPEKAAAPSRKTPQIFRKSGNAPTSDAVEKARRQTSLPRSDSVPLLRMSADADWPRVVEGGNERLTEAGRESHGPLDGVARDRLVEMITELQRELNQTTDELKKSRAQTADMEEYLDSLLLRIMEISPQLLQSPTKPAAVSAKYGPRGG